MTNHYKDKLDTSVGRVAGLSRKAGDASQEVKAKIIATIKQFGDEFKLSIKDVANLIAFAKIESGYNPDAAARGDWTSAAGVFQITDSTASDASKRLSGKPRVNGVDPGTYDRFDYVSNVKYGIVVYLDKKARAKSDDAYDIYAVWNSNPDEYEKYKEQLKTDVEDNEKTLKQEAASGSGGSASAGRKIIVLSDPTSHGGKVISGSAAHTIGGKPIARKGDKVDCPEKYPDGSPHGVNEIIEGEANMPIDGIPVALEGHKTVCGCALIGTSPATYG